MEPKIKSPFAWLLGGALSIWSPYGLWLCLCLIPRYNHNKLILFGIGFLGAWFRPIPVTPTWLTGEPTSSIQIQNWRTTPYGCQGEALYKTQSVFWKSKHCKHILEGNNIQVQGYFDSLKTLQIPGTFSYQNYLQKLGFSGYLQIQQIQQISYTPPTLDISQIQNYLRLQIQTTFAQAAPLVQALLLGEKNNLSIKDKKNIQSLGLSHLLAISGMHIGFLALLLYQLFRIFRIPYRYSYLLSAVLLLAFLPLCHSPASALRAWCMYFIWVLHHINERKSSPWNILAFTATILLFYSPNYLYQIGFQLSFAAMAAIFWITPYIKHWPSLKQGILLSSWISFLLLPLVAYSFHQVSLWAPLTNIFAVPFCFAILISAIGALLRVPYWQETTDIITHLFLQTNDLLASYLTPLTLSSLDLLYFAPIFFFIPIRLSKLPNIFSYTFVIFLYTSLWSYFQLQPPAALRIHILDVHQGNAILLENQNNSLWIDLGSKPYHASTLQSYQHSLGINQTDALIVTHADYDHWAAAQRMPNSYKELWVTPQALANPKPSWQKFIAKTKQQKLIQTLQAGDQILFKDSNIRIKVLYPYSNQKEKNNHASIVLHIRIGTQDILLMGDLEKEGESILQKQYTFPDSVEVYLAGHHGSNTSNSFDFLQHSKIQWMIVSSGHHKSWQHPHPNVLQSAQFLKIPVWQTKKCGSLLLSVYPDHIKSKQTFCKETVPQQFTTK